MPLTLTQRKKLTTQLQRSLSDKLTPLEHEHLIRTVESERGNTLAFFDENPKSTKVAGELLGAMLDNTLHGLSQSDPAFEIALMCDDTDEYRKIIGGLVMYAYYLGRTEQKI